MAFLLRLRQAALGLTLAALPVNGLLAGDLDDGAAPADIDDASVEKARDLFNIWACASCHVLADAGAQGTAGPSLDGNPNLQYDFIVNRIANGQGAMPPFAGSLTDEEMGLLSAYIMKVAQR